MIGKYKARNGSVITIDGVSEYTSFGNSIVLLSGTVNDEIGAWNGNGKYRIHEILGINEQHELDIISSLEDNINEVKND